MKLVDYANLYPNEKVFGRVLTKADGTSALVTEGMLVFDDDSACNWGGPFEGGCAYYCLADHRNLLGTGKLITEGEHRQIHRFATYAMPYGRWKEPAQNEEHLEKRLASLTVKERKEWESHQASWVIENATVERPFSIYMAGNDDTSYTKFYPTLDAAKEELDFFLADQPLNMHVHVIDNGFVFTN